MPQYDYDLFVIGAGSGGVRAARLAAMTGARVAVAEEHEVGGTCVVRGCIPKKFMVYASDFSHEFKVAKSYGWHVEARFDWREFLTAKDIEIARLSGIYTANLGKAGVELFHERAQFVDPHRLDLKNSKRTVSAEKVLIATGGRPFKPDDLAGVEHAITSEEAFHLPHLPKRIVVVGGGYIAVEFAGIFAGLGVETTLVYRGSNILRGFDDDVRAHLTDQIERRGIRVILGGTHEVIEKRDSGLLSKLDNGIEVESDQVMFATGRKPYTHGLGLDAAGVKLKPTGAVAVDEYSRTNVEHIWAIGDVTDRMNLTPVAIREAIAFCETAFKNHPSKFDYDNVPTAVFSQPPVGTVGLTEAEARKHCGKIDVYLSRFRPQKTTLTKIDERVMMKLVVDPRDQKILGAHIVGPEAAEMIQFAAIAIKAGITKPQWDATCALHPTIGEEMVTMREKYIPPELAAAE
ncbi:MAG TPA: glutathione-disulfide reductase [Caulobacteraceae bacterium]|jgi:glutathione reductase (NADPH)